MLNSSSRIESQALWVPKHMLNNSVTMRLRQISWRHFENEEHEAVKHQYKAEIQYESHRRFSYCHQNVSKQMREQHHGHLQLAVAPPGPKTPWKASSPTTISETELACGVGPLLTPNTEVIVMLLLTFNFQFSFTKLNIHGQKQTLIFLFLLYLQKNKFQNSRGKERLCRVCRVEVFKALSG
jgi:hypothetical protein